MGERLAFTKDLSVDFPGRIFGEFRNKYDLSGIFVLAQVVADPRLDFLDESAVTGPAGDDERFHDAAAERVWNADRGGLLNVGVFEDGVFDLDCAHGPAG